jgi:ABC-2 type transport system permease protein
MIFTDGFKGGAVVEALLNQAFWSLLLIVPIYFMWSLAKRQLIVQGG